VQLNFPWLVSGEDYEIGILVNEDLPLVTIKRNGHIKHRQKHFALTVSPFVVLFWIRASALLRTSEAVLM
jgi:hypothetical protein